MNVYKLFTTHYGSSDFSKGRFEDSKKIASIYFFLHEDPIERRFSDWHPAPRRQYVITLRGILEFTVTNGQSFILRPGDVLIADDVLSTGHKWRMISEESWIRAYIVLTENDTDGFIANP